MKTQKEVIDSLTETTMATLRDREDMFVQQLLLAYQEGGRQIVSRIMEIYRELGAEGWNYAVASRSGRLPAVLADINRVISQINQRAVDATGHGMMNQYSESVEGTAWMLDQATPSNIGINMPDLVPGSVQAIVAAPYEGAMFSQRIGHVNDQMADDIKNGLTQSLINGESMSDAGDRIDDIIGDEDGGWAYRSKTIAQTEIMRAQNLGREDVFDENEDLMAGKPLWMITPDDRLCPWCLRCDGKTAAEIKDLPASMGKKEDPTLGTTRPPKHPKCRCTIRPQLKSWSALIGVDMPEDFGPEERGIRNDAGKWEYAPVQKFDDWKAERMGKASSMEAR